MPELVAYPLPYDAERNFYPYASEANIFLLTDTWSSSSPRPYCTFRSLILIVESPLQDCVVTYFIPTCDDGYQLSWTRVRSWISLIQSSQMSHTGISPHQRNMLLDIALAFFGSANQHPDLQPQELFLLSGALIKAVDELRPREHADTHLHAIARTARREFPISVFEGVDIPTIDEGLTPDNIKDIFHHECEFVLQDWVVFAAEAEHLATRIRSRAELTMSDERVITLSRRVWVHAQTSTAATWVDVTNQVDHWQGAPEDKDDDFNYDDMPELEDLS